MDNIRWEPVEKYSNIETLFLKSGRRRTIQIGIRGRLIDMSDDNGCSMTALLRPDHAICHAVAADEAGVPSEIAQTIRDMAGDWLQTYDEGDEEYERANAALAWLDSLSPLHEQEDTTHANP